MRSEVIDETAGGFPGIYVVLNRWHVHTDSGGYFHWSVEAPIPEQQVEIKVYKRYNGDYETLKTTMPFSQLESQPIILPRKR